jgi:hypothetical protein
LLSWWFEACDMPQWISMRKLSQKSEEINNLLHLPLPGAQACPKKRQR